ncbi:uncharacterized protein LOC115456371 [Manduca sexta]|uniref:Uncharacterized protein n=1 Tax=Manduca sexta TaxID=7130 RepID=A0A921YR49_MANSE|nr:uncharacterized protein LOC115456371 [Manduca sexta]KAG6444101.1 hypothetical protein O3G_MSEX003196 [Manduca sexta]
MNCVWFALVFALNKNYHVHCSSSNEYSDSEEYSSERDTEQLRAYSTEYSDESADSRTYESSSYEDFSSGSYERDILQLKGYDGDLTDHELIDRYISEMKAGSPADLFGTNQHYRQPVFYKDLSRRFVPQYLYTEVKNKIKKNKDNRLTPKLASPELVLAVAKKSALLEASKPLKQVDEKLQKDILRTGEFWNDVWREDVNPETLLRTVEEKNNLETMNIKIMPGSSLYDVASKLKERSPRLLYIINNKQKKK